MCGCVKYASAGNSSACSRVPWSRFAATMSNQRAVRQCREALRIAIKPLPVGWKTDGVRTEAPLRLQPPPANWSLIACCENSSCDAQSREANEQSRIHEDLTGNSRVHSRVPTSALTSHRSTIPTDDAAVSAEAVASV